jgi:K+-transporting ATPase ATPase C chain
MIKEIAKETKNSVLFVALFTVLVGLIYPGMVTLFSQLLFPRQANGSLIVANGKTVGSELIGQPFDDGKYFWGRPSATSPQAYNAASSGGSNSGPTNPDFINRWPGWPRPGAWTRLRCGTWWPRTPKAGGWVLSATQGSTCWN